MIQPADYVEKILQMTDVAHVYAYNAMVRKDQCYLSVIWSVIHLLFVGKEVGTFTLLI